MATPFDRLMTTASVHLPGATEQAMIQELFFVCQQFFKRSEIWQENYEVELPPGQNTVTITPAAGRVERLMGVSSGGQPVRGAVMFTPGEVTIPRSVNATSEYVITVVMTVSDPTDTASFPIAPVELIDRYSEELMHGLLSRMFPQPSKPYTNLSLAQYYTTKFTGGISRARNDARTFYLAGAQRWSFPNSGGISIGGGGGQVIEGPSGPEGLQGPVGPSLYEEAVADGYAGTFDDFIDSLRGAEGPIGPEGPQGPTGTTAYELAVEQGFVGTLEDWLETLVGPQGPQGVAGANGPQGAQGPQGIQGPTGPMPTNSDQLTEGATNLLMTPAERAKLVDLDPAQIDADIASRLRVDAAQGLTGTQQAQGRSNLALGSAAVAATTAFATAAQGTKADNALRVDAAQGLTGTQQAQGRSNLALGSAAVAASTAFATSVQGAKADAALPAASYTAADVQAKVSSTDNVPEGATNQYFTSARVRSVTLSGYALGASTALTTGDTFLGAMGKIQAQINDRATAAQGAKADTAIQRIDMGKLPNKYMRKIICQLPIRPPGYTANLAILTAENSDVTYLYPQAFWIDDVANEYVILFCGKGGAGRNWVVHFNKSTLAFKRSYFAGVGYGPIIIYYTVEGGATKRKMILYSGASMLRFDITTLPAEGSSPSSTTVANADAYLYGGMSKATGELLTPERTPAQGNYRRVNRMVWRSRDGNFPRRTAYYSDLEAVGDINDIGAVMPHGQDVDIGSAKVMWSFGGNTNLGSTDYTPGQVHGIRVFNMNGDLEDSILYDPIKLLDILVTAGVSATRIENEGIFVDKNDIPYCLTCTLSATTSTGTATAGILITQELAPDDGTNLDCSAARIDAAAPAFNRMGRFVRFYRSNDDAGGVCLRNPLTQAIFASINDMTVFMEYAAVDQVMFYTTDAPALVDFNGDTLPGSCQVVINNMNNGTFFYEILGTARSRKFLINNTPRVQTPISRQSFKAVGASGSLTASTLSKVTFNGAKPFDTAGYSTGTGRFTPVSSGVWRISAHVNLGALTVGQLVQIAIFKGGVQMDGALLNDTTVSASRHSLTITALDNAVAGDYYEIFVNAGSTGNLSASNAIGWFEAEMV